MVRLGSEILTKQQCLVTRLLAAEGKLEYGHYEI